MPRMGDWCGEAEPANLLGGDRVVWAKGINFDGRQDAIRDALREGRPRVPSAKIVRTYARLVRDRGNRNDANACAVLLGEHQVGFLPRALAELLAPVLDTFDAPPTCRALVKRVEDGARLVALVGPWPDCEPAYGDVADALEDADPPMIRADWTAALAALSVEKPLPVPALPGADTPAFVAMGQRIIEQRAELARLRVDVDAIYGPDDRGAEYQESIARLAEAERELAATEAEYARQLADRAAKASAVAAPPAEPSGSAFVGCLILVVGALLFGGCIFVGWRSCAKDKPPPDERASTPDSVLDATPAQAAEPSTEWIATGDGLPVTVIARENETSLGAHAGWRCFGRIETDNNVDTATVRCENGKIGVRTHAKQVSGAPLVDATPLQITNALGDKPVRTIVLGPRRAAE